MRPGRLFSIFALCVLTFALLGCQQKMATQPAPRAYEESDLFADGVSARPLEPGVVYRGEPAAGGGHLAGLTADARKPKAGDASGAAAYDIKNVIAPTGAPGGVGLSAEQANAQFVKDLPFPMTEADYERGQQRFNTFCALCHGASGHGDGKIVERGFLRPPSYHVDPEGKKGDYSTMADASRTEAGAVGLKQGHSRGFYRYGHQIPLDQVNVGYIYSVITWGYGGMADHASQIPVDDRWRIAAYIRALQLSQKFDLADAGVSAETKKRLTEALDGKKPAAPAAGH
jgi:Cytochrome C oxidase, cbb3-type, subunit III